MRSCNGRKSLLAPNEGSVELCASFAAADLNILGLIASYSVMVVVVYYQGYIVAVVVSIKELLSSQSGCCGG